MAAVDRKLFRSADVWDGFSFAGSPTGEEGGSEKPWKQRLRVKSARGEEALNLHCAKKCHGRDVRVRVEVRRAPWRRRIRAGGGPRTRWGERVWTARRRRKCAVSVLGVEEKVIAREIAQGQVRRRIALEWQGGGRVSVAKTGVGWPEEPHLRGVLEVRFRRSSNTHRIAVSQCVGCGVILRRSANTHGNARCIPVFWVWGGR